MTEPVVRIPGKVMLSGEYAVLYGAWSVLTQVPRYLTFTESDEPPETHYPPPVETARTIEIPELERFEDRSPLEKLHIDRSPFYTENAVGDSIKLGLGSSAAEAVGVIALRYERAGKVWQDHRNDVLELALDAHREAQGGVGSGADVAACAWNGPIRYQWDGNDRYTLEPIRLSRGQNHVPLALVWSGQAANTRTLVKPFQSWANEAKQKEDSRFFQWLIYADELAQAWFSASPDILFGRLDRFNAAMQLCAQEAGIPFLLDVHHELDAWARSHGGRAKPTGAGGGDMILLVGELPCEELELDTIQLM